MALLILVAIIIAGFIIYHFYSLPSTEDELYQLLVRRCFGDKELVERLIELESKRSPHATRATLIQHALNRLTRDNR
jgi:hypothetical protein